MGSPLTQAGALTDPTKFAPLHTNRFMTGLWTNRNQLRDAATTFLYEKFYSASRFDSLIGGLNGELTAKMTAARRPGHSVYNSQTFPPITRFYPFKTFSTKTTNIRLMADTAGAVYDATGPNRKLNIWNKSFGAGSSTFQSVGNNLFFGNGVDQKKWVQKEPQWATNTNFNFGQYVVDSNNNLQVAVGGLVVGVVSVAVAGNVLTLTLDPSDPALPSNLMALVGLPLTLSGFVSATFLNGATITIASVPQGFPAYSSNVLTAPFVYMDYGPVADAGAASSGSGISGGAAPAWQTTIGAATIDGGQRWICKGPSVQDWGFAAPTKAPTVVQSALPQIYPAWTAQTYYSTCFLILDGNGFIQQVTAFGTTGSVEPAFTTGTGGTTADNTVVWTCTGPSAYASNAHYAEGYFIVQTDATGAKFFYKAMTDGIAGSVTPIFPSPLGAQVVDGGVTWANVGVVAHWSDITASSIIGNFGIIPVQGGGSVAIGMGQGQANGTAIALPTGYSSSNMLSWNSPGSGFSGGPAVMTGVHQATSAGGILNSSMQDEHGAFAFNANSNWAAVTWSTGAAVVISSAGGFQYLTFTTLAGDQLSICVGTLNNGATVPVPAGYLAADSINLVGMSGCDNVNHVMQGIVTCSLGPGLVLTTQYTDNDGPNVWAGPANALVVFFKTGGTITTQLVTGGIALIIPTTVGNSLSLIQAQIANGASFGLPAGYGSSTLISTTAMSGWTASGTNHGHGYSCSVTGLTGSYFYQDGSGNTWFGSGNVFALAVVLDTTPISPAQKIVDANNNLQQIAISGLSGAVAPAWQTLQGLMTTDNTASWVNTGLTSAQRTQPSRWAFAYKTSATNHTGTASPMSSSVVLNANNFAFLQGEGSPDRQVDIIVIYRIPQGGSTLLYEDEIPAPPPGQMWQYSDQLPDSFLNVQLPAAIAHTNDPPPVGFKPLEYHLSRIFGAVANVLSWSNGTQQTGDPNQSFNPDNFFTFPSTIVRAWACTLGLLVFTVSDVFIVLGSATAADPLFPKKYIPGLGLLNYDAFTCNKTTPYMMDSTKKVMALDPSAGLIEPGFPIADQFDALYSASTAQLTWHEGAHGDTALYAGDAIGSWFRMAALSAPEQGLIWSPKGTIAAGYGAMSSVEVTPGKKLLLLGPAGNGPILYRDPTVNTDNGALYPWNMIIGSIVLAQPGQIAATQFMTLESVKLGTSPILSVMLGEIDGPLHPDLFEKLYVTRQDPPLQPKAKTLLNDRYDFMQNQNVTYCRHMQIRFDWLAEDFRNELLTYTIFGALFNEMESK